MSNPRASWNSYTTKGLTQTGNSFRGRTITLKKAVSTTTDSGKFKVPVATAKSTKASTASAPLVSVPESKARQDGLVPGNVEIQEAEPISESLKSHSTITTVSNPEMTVEREREPLLPSNTNDIAPAAESDLDPQATTLTQPGWVAPPPQHSHADREAAYRFGGKYQ
ncbi:UNVERIFIED_CONTAM: hypothetical protein HDU68_003091 [Siphonaria sp. JEL0065]|nr:hypothetical protein HDU68_003091 [Siphonaria sp. JEL0065]